MQDFKKIVKNFIFFIILFAIFAGVSKKMETVMIENDNLVQIRNKSVFRILREPKNSIDVIVVGDSLSYSSISPMVLWKNQGITSYVCGQAGQKIQETYHMLETAFETQSPKLVILETNAMFRGKPGLARVKETIEEWANHYIPIFRCHDIWKSFFIDKQYPEENYKGFSFRCVVKPYEEGEYMHETKQKADLPDIVITYMEKIKELCSANKAKLLLVGTPSPVNYNYRKHNSIRTYAADHSLDYLDLNLKLSELGIDWKTDSLDKGDHLNLSGAQKVSQYLGKYLKSEYELPDHRGESFYDGWNKEMETYSQKAEAHLKAMINNENRTD